MKITPKYIFFIGAVIGAAITITVFYFFLKPNDNSDYKEKYAVEHANNMLLEKRFAELKAHNIILMSRVHDDSLKAFTDLHNLPSIQLKYVPTHDSVRHLDDDGTAHFTRSRLPRNSPD